MEIASGIVVYLLKSGVAFAALYLLYCAVFRQIQNFVANRFYLLFCAFFSLVFPFIRFTTYVQVVVPATVHDNEVVGEIAGAVVNDAPHFALPSIIINAYLVVAALMLLRLLFILAVFLFRLYRSSSCAYINGRKVLVTNCWKQTFSFSNIIVLPQADFSQNNCDVLLSHELAHVKQYHTVDMLLAELFQIIQWFNPLAYRLKKDLCEVHEFLADSYVVRCGVNRIEYQQTLLNYVESSIAPSVANMFSAKLLKRRFAMMTLDSSPKKMYKYLFSIPLVAVLVLAMSCNTQEIPVVAAAAEEKVEEQVIAETKDKNMEDEAFVIVEEMPKYSGGGIDEFRLGHVQKCLVYPEEAAKHKIQGRVYVNFVIDAGGNVTKVKVIREVHPLLDEEVVRVISASPSWTPGKQRGKNLAVQYTIPVIFKLDDSE